MTNDPSSTQSLRRVFTEGFSAEDIAEPLASFDASANAATVQAVMERRGYEVAGVREDGQVVGYVQRFDLATLSHDECCVKALRPLKGLGELPSQAVSETASAAAPEDPADPQAGIVLGSAPLAEVIVGLQEFPRLFVMVFGRVGAIVTRSDLQKPPVRMWLFGMITLIEMRLNSLITQGCSEQEWKPFVSPARLQKAEELLAERIRRNQHLGLLDCLQFADKGQIVARNEQLRRHTRLQSRRQAEQMVKQLEKLRNNLAHSQDIVTGDWETIVELSQNLDQLIAGPPTLRG